MKERLNTVLLLVVIVLLVFLIVRPKDEVGRFQVFAKGTSLALDTKTGQACATVGGLDTSPIPFCPDLATQ